MNEPVIKYTAYLEGSLLLDKSGRWWHNGQPFENEKLANFFHRAIVYDDSAGRYFIRIGEQQATFSIEDCAYFVRAVDDSLSPWRLLLNIGSTKDLDAATLYLGEAGELYCTVLGQPAKFLSAAYQTITKHVVDEATLQVGKQKISLLAPAKE